MRDPILSLKKRLTRLRRFPALCRVDGAPFVLDPRNWIDNRLLAGAPYETAQLALARAMIVERKADLLLDIGANFGLYTILLGRLDQILEAHAFEPVRRNFNQMLGNVFSNSLDAKVTAYRVALGAERATLTAHVDPASTGVSRLDLSTTWRDARVFRQQEQVEVHRLDTLVTREGRRAFVKIDVEGKAGEVIAGMAHFLTRNAGVLQVEISSTEAGVPEQLETLGWRSASSIDNDHYFTKSAMHG